MMGGIACDGENYYLQLSEMDDNSDPNTVESNYQSMLGNNDIDFFLGPYSSSLSARASAVAGSADRVLLLGGASADSLYVDTDKTFLMFTPASQYFVSIADSLISKGASSFCILSIDSTFPRASAEGIKQYLASLSSITYNADIKYHAQGDEAHIRSTLIECRDLGYDVILGSTNTLPDAEGYVTQAKAIGYYPKALVINVYGASPELTQALGEDALGVFGPTQWSPNLPSMESDDIFGTASQYTNAYLDSEHTDSGDPPSYQTAGSSACVVTYYYAILAAAASLTSGQSITQAMIAEQILTLDRPSFFGNLQFQQNGGILKPMYATQIQVNAGDEGIFPLVAPDNVASEREEDGRKFEPIYPVTYHNIDSTCNDLIVNVLDAPTDGTCFPGKSRIKIAASISKTGKYAPKADHLKKGYNLAIDLINAKVGGIPCGGAIYPLEFVEAEDDDGSNTNVVSNVYTSLVQDTDVDFLVGPYSSSLSLSAAAVAQENDRVIIHGGASSDSLLEFGSKNFLTYTTASQYMVEAMQEAQRKGVDAICLLSISTSFPTAVAEGALAEANRLNFPIVGDSIKYHEQDATTAIRDHLQACADADENQAVAVFASTNTKEDSVAYITESKAIGYFPKLLVITVYGPSPTLVEEVGDDALGVVGPTQWSENLPSSESEPIMGSPQDYLYEYLQSQHVVSGQPPSYQTAGASAAILAYYYAIKNAGANNFGQAITQEMVAEELHALNQVSFWGTLQFNDDGSTNKPMYATQIQINAQTEGIYPVVVPANMASTKDNGDSFLMQYPGVLHNANSGASRVTIGSCDDAESNETVEIVLVLVIVLIVLQFCFIGFMVYKESQGKPLFGYQSFTDSPDAEMGTEMPDVKKRSADLR